MKAVTVTFIINEDEESSLEDHINGSGLLNEWPVFAWLADSADTEQLTWYQSEYVPALEETA